MNKELDKLLLEMEDNAAEHARAGKLEFAVELSEYVTRIKAIFSNTGLTLLKKNEA